MFFYLLSYPIIGAGIKYMDVVFDDGSVSKKLALSFAFISVILYFILCITTITLYLK
jgi:hypothetical protein